MAINKNTPPNVVGEPFKEYVNGQIKVRQQAHGSGFKSTRSDKDLVYLNSRNAWVKMASSVDVLGQELPSLNQTSSIRVGPIFWSLPLLSKYKEFPHSTNTLYPNLI